jgi:hypothetical protein
MKNKKQVVTAEDIIENLKSRGVVINSDPNPVGKHQNFSLMGTWDKRLVLRGSKKGLFNSIIKLFITRER